MGRLCPGSPNKIAGFISCLFDILVEQEGNQPTKKSTQIPSPHTASVTFVGDLATAAFQAFLGEIYVCIRVKKQSFHECTIYFQH